MSVGSPHTVRLAEPVGEFELVHLFTGAMPTGVTVSHGGRVFVNFPEWGDHPPATVVEIVAGRERPYPNGDWNSSDGPADDEGFVSVQSVVVDPVDRLWVLDTGSPMFQPTKVAAGEQAVVLRADRGDL